MVGDGVAGLRVRTSEGERLRKREGGEGGLGGG